MGKWFSLGGVPWNPPLCTNGSAGYLMQLSVKMFLTFSSITSLVMEVIIAISSLPYILLGRYSFRHLPFIPFAYSKRLNLFLCSLPISSKIVSISFTNLSTAVGNGRGFSCGVKSFNRRLYAWDTLTFPRMCLSYDVTP